MLRLDKTAVSNAGLEHLLGMTELRDLSLAGSQVTEEGIARLKSALPEIEIRMTEE